VRTVKMSHRHSFLYNSSHWQQSKHQHLFWKNWMFLFFRTDFSGAGRKNHADAFCD